MRTLGEPEVSLCAHISKWIMWYVMLPKRIWTRKYNPKGHHLVERYLAMLRLNAMEQVQNPNDLVEVEEVFTGHPLPFRDCRAHLLYWLEIHYGTKHAKNAAEKLHQADIEAYLCRKYPEAIEEMRDGAAPHASSLAAHMSQHNIEEDATAGPTGEDTDLDAAVDHLRFALALALALSLSHTHTHTHT
jgi:hypothetical protein